MLKPYSYGKKRKSGARISGTGKSITLDAPAKINLYLDVIKRRKDGYHDLSTIFQKIDLSDKITVSIIKKGILIDCKYPHIPTGASNIAYKAARLMIDRFRLTAGVRIKIVKNIPVAAGLGGGSSDAASVILAINELFGLKLGLKSLIPLAKTIGADVPFFVSGLNCAKATGIGDRLKEVNNSLSFYILLVIPKIRLYTKTIYNKLAHSTPLRANPEQAPALRPGSAEGLTLPLTKSPLNATMLARLLSGAKNNGRAVDMIANLLYNRFESVVFSDYPIVKEGKKLLSLYSRGVLLSGSGPTIFALFNHRKGAMEVKDKLSKDSKWRVLFAKTI